MTLSTVAAGSSSEEVAPARWWDSPFRMFQTNLREIDATLDVNAVLDFVEDYGASAWLMNAGGIMSFYPSDLEFQQRNPFLAGRPGGDLVGDAVTAAHDRGIRLLSRMDFSKVHEQIADRHPEWCFVSPDGERQVYNGLVSVCPSGEYYHDRTLEILDEVIDRYPIDGFFFNWFGFNEVDYSAVYRGVCHCDNCTREFPLATGIDTLPTGPRSENYAVWRAFATARIDLVTERIRSHIASRRPDAGLILGRRADIVFHEANNAIGRDFWPHETSQVVSAIKSAHPGTAVLVNSVAFVDMPYRMASEQPELFSQYLVQAISRGANPSSYIMGTPGDVPFLGLAPAREIVRFHSANEVHYAGLRSVATLALVEPTVFNQDAVALAEARAEFRGLYCALLERHVPFDVVDQADLAALLGAETDEDGGLSRYDVVVLPDLGELAEAEARGLDAWVERGGRLVSTGSSGMTSDGAVQLAASPATRRVGILAGVDTLRSRYVVRAVETLGDRMRYGSPIVALHGAVHSLEWRSDAEPHLVELGQARFGPPEKAYGNEPTGQPGFASIRYGAGTAVTVPWTIGRAYREIGTTVHRDLFVDEVLGATGWLPQLTAELPEQVEIVAARNADEFVIHVNNLSGVRRASVGPHLGVQGGVLRLRGVAASGAAVPRPARALVSARDCVTRVVGDDLLIELPDLELFEVVVVPLEAGSARS